MWQQKALVAAAALVALSGSVQANTVTVTGSGAPFGISSASDDFFLSGDNTSPPDTPIMTLSASTPLMLPGFIAGLTTFVITGNVSGPGVSQVSPFNGGLSGGSNVSGAGTCNLMGCSPAAFTAPTGQLNNIPLTVSGALNIMGGGGAITGPVPFTLSLATTEPGLTLQPVPLPAALPLFGSGLGALGLLGWRRKRRALAVA